MENNFEAAEKYPEEVFKVFVQELQQLQNEIEEFFGGSNKKIGKVWEFSPQFLWQKNWCFSAEKWVFYDFSTLFSIERFLPFVEIKPRNQSKYNMKLFSFEFLISLDFSKV